MRVSLDQASLRVIADQRLRADAERLLADTLPAPLLELKIDARSQGEAGGPPPLAAFPHHTLLTHRRAEHQNTA
jgi:hypothetical protein